MIHGVFDIPQRSINVRGREPTKRMKRFGIRCIVIWGDGICIATAGIFSMRIPSEIADWLIAK